MTIDCVCAVLDKGIWGKRAMDLETIEAVQEADKGKGERFAAGDARVEELGIEACVIQFPAGDYGWN